MKNILKYGSKYVVAADDTSEFKTKFKRLIITNLKRSFPGNLMVEENRITFSDVPFRFYFTSFFEIIQSGEIAIEDAGRFINLRFEVDVLNRLAAAFFVLLFFMILFVVYKFFPLYFVFIYPFPYFGFLIILGIYAYLRFDSFIDRSIMEAGGRILE